MKFDGYRALAFKSGKEVRLVSRNQTDFGNDYPQLIDSLKILTAKNVVIDGEIAALDQHGRTSFQLLQSYGKTKKIPLVYYAFDLLNLEGTDLRSRPLVERRKLLAKVLKKAPDEPHAEDRLVPTEHWLKAPGSQADVLQLWMNDGVTIHDGTSSVEASLDY